MFISTLRYLKHLIKNYLSKSKKRKSIQENVPEVELEFFNMIKPHTNVIFDVGCRNDIDYIKASLDKSREFHFFDPDPAFILNIKEELSNISDNLEVDNQVYLNAFGLGKESRS